MILPFPNVKSKSQRVGDELMLEAMEMREVARYLLSEAQRKEIEAITHWAKAEAERFKASAIVCEHPASR